MLIPPLRISNYIIIVINFLYNKYIHLHYLILILSSRSVKLLISFISLMKGKTKTIHNFIDKNTVADASIDGNSNVSHKDIVTLEKEITVGSLKVNVFDPDGNPMSDATVKVNGQTYTTDSNGNVAISELEAGEYEVIVTKDGYKAQAKLVVVKANEEAVLSVTMEKVSYVGSVTFTIHTPDNTPLADVSITIGGKTYKTDENGKVTIVGAGWVCITVSSASGRYAFKDEHYPGEISGQAAGLLCCG